MLTPQEIQDQKFEKAMFGGYDMAQIDKFLDQLLGDYSSLYKENAALKAKMRVLVDKIEEYRAVDDELRKTLYNAQITAKDTISRAQTEAERILRDARVAANRSVTDLQGQVAAEEKRLEDAKRQSAAYAEKIRRAMELSLHQMDEILLSSEKKEAAAPAAAPVQPPVSQDTTVFVSAAKPETVPEEPAPAVIPAPPAEPLAEVEDAGVVLELEVEEESLPKADPQSDTARIYGDSPFTPKPRFNFEDMRFGKQYDAENDND